MFNSGKYKWSIAVVALLLLLAIYRMQVTKTEKVNRPQPLPHGQFSAEFAAIPQPLGADFDHPHALDTANQLESEDFIEEQVENEIERFALSADGGDFESSQFRSQSSELNSEQDALSEPELVLADQRINEIEDAYTRAEPQGGRESEYQNGQPDNPVLQGMQTDEAPLDVAVESVPDFEPTFARTQTEAANGPIQLSRGVLIKVVNHIEYGKSLARRGAVYGAKQEFLAALKLVAQSIDARRGGSLHADAYFDAIQALRESDDFYRAQSQQHRRVDVVAIAKNHRSRVTQPSYLRGLNPMQAMQMYYDYVQDRLVASSGNTIVAGEALYCLGKLHQVNAKDPIDGSQIDNAKSVVFYNAAVNCDPRNYKSANELGVMMARAGRLEESKRLFLNSLKVHQVSKVWANLAGVHRQLGENDMAQLAETEYRRMLEGPAANRIIWVQPETFANQSKNALATRTASAAQVQPSQTEPKKSNRGLRGIMKKLF